MFRQSSENWKLKTNMHRKPRTFTLPIMEEQWKDIWHFKGPKYFEIQADKLCGIFSSWMEIRKYHNEMKTSQKKESSITVHTALSMKASLTSRPGYLRADSGIPLIPLYSSHASFPFFMCSFHLPSSFSDVSLLRNASGAEFILEGETIKFILYKQSVLSKIWQDL